MFKIRMNTKTYEIKGFHPSGEPFHSGHCYMNGKYWLEVKENIDKIHSLGEVSATIILPEQFKLMKALPDYTFTKGIFSGTYRYESFSYGKDSLGVNLWGMTKRKALKSAKELCTRIEMPLVLVCTTKHKKYIIDYIEKRNKQKR